MIINIINIIKTVLFNILYQFIYIYIYYKMVFNVKDIEQFTVQDIRIIYNFLCTINLKSYQYNIYILIYIYILYK